MASDCFILAHDNIFNRSVLGDNAIYYSSQESVTGILDCIDSIAEDNKEQFIMNNIEIIRKEYSWEKLVDKHEEYFKWMLEHPNNI